MQSAQDFIDAFAAEVGDEIVKMVEPVEILRWVNRAQTRLGIYLPRVTTIGWSGPGQVTTLPSDFHHPERLDFGAGSPVAHQWFGGSLVITDRLAVAANATLYYWATFPKVTGASDSQLPDEGDDACVSYCLYRFFKRLASSRADYRRYATITAQNGVDISELDALSERHFNDFDDARNDLQESAHSAAPYFEG